MNPSPPGIPVESNSPSMEDHLRVIQQIYANGYFTNHGPLAKRFELQLESWLNIKNVVAVGSESLAVLIALAGLELDGDLVLPAMGAGLVAELSQWLNQAVRYCDVQWHTCQASQETISPVLDDEVAAVCLVEPWGKRCDPNLIRWLGEQGKAILVLTAGSSPGRYAHERGGDQPRIATVYGFGPRQILSTMQGGAIATSDDGLAERFRNIRSSYGMRQKVDVVATCNGRFSEYQAGMGLRSLERLAGTQRANQTVADVYRERLVGVAGLALCCGTSGSEVSGDGFSGDCLPLRVGAEFPLTRDQLKRELANRGLVTSVAKPSSVSMPVSDQLGRELILLPVHQIDLANHGTGSVSGQELAVRITAAILSLSCVRGRLAVRFLSSGTAFSTEHLGW